MINKRDSVMKNLKEGEIIEIKVWGDFDNLVTDSIWYNPFVDYGIDEIIQMISSSFPWRKSSNKNMYDLKVQILGNESAFLKREDLDKLYDLLNLYGWEKIKSIKIVID